MRKYFYPRTPCGVRLGGLVVLLLELGISIHVPRAGYDAATTSFVVRTGAFLSTYPVRGTTIEGRRMPLEPDISIHVPRAGYVFSCRHTITPSCIFLSTYPVRGTTRRHHRFTVRKAIFLSTYPVRGTTSAAVASAVFYKHFYPRTPCGVRPRRGP